jgi:hypothetical protein
LTGDRVVGIFAFMRLRFSSLFWTMVLLGAWLLAMRAVYLNNYAGPPGTSLDSIGRIAAGSEQWMGIYLDGRKIGYSYRSIEPVGDGYALRDESLLKLSLAGTVQEIYVTSFVRVDSAFHLRVGTFSLYSGDYETTANAVVEDNEIEVSISGDSNRIARSPVDEPVTVPALLPYAIVDRGLVPGEYYLNTFDPLTLSTRPLSARLGTPTWTHLGDGYGKLYPITVNLSGLVSTMWIDSTGTVHKEEEPGGLLALAEDEKTATALPVEEIARFDLLRALAIPADRDMSDARDARGMRVRLNGIVPAFFDLDGDAQRVISTDPLVIVITPYRVEPSPPPDSSALAETPFVQPGDRRVREAAEQAVRDATDDVERIERIAGWVHDNIERDPTLSLPSAVEVLSHRRGDCNEHTVLAVAMCRSLGIPAVQESGLVASDDAFFYHAWPACYADGRWWRPDPTLGQKTSDATHIRLVVGGYDRQVQLVRALGSLEVEVQEVW